MSHDTAAAGLDTSGHTGQYCPDYFASLPHLVRIAGVGHRVASLVVDITCDDDGHC